MRKISVLILIISLLVCFAHAQRRQNQRPNQRRRGNGEGGGLERPLPPRRGPRQEKELRDQQQLEEEAGSNKNATNRRQRKPDKKSLQSERFKQEKDEREGRPLIKLIFILVGAIILVALILLLKLINRTDQQGSHNAENPPTILVPTKKTPQVQLEEEIKAHKKRLRKLEMLRRIKAKYLINSTSSQMQLAREEQFCKNHEQDLKTPSFTNPFTFRSTA